jgi:hypothetical protein
MDNQALPTYIGTTHLARELRYRNYNLTVMIRKWANDPKLPCPAPDAYLYRENDTTMLWLKDRLPEWHEWNRQRINLTRARAHAGLAQGRPPKLGNQPERPLQGDQ